MGRSRENASTPELRDEKLSGAVDGGQSKNLAEGRVQKNEVKELGDGKTESTQEGIGNIPVEVNPNRGSQAVEFPATDDEGNTTVEHFDAGMRHLVTSELAEAKDPQGVPYFKKLEE